MRKKLKTNKVVVTSILGEPRGREDRGSKRWRQGGKTARGLLGQVEKLVRAVQITPQKIKKRRSGLNQEASSDQQAPNHALHAVKGRYWKQLPANREERARRSGHIQFEKKRNRKESMEEGINGSTVGGGVSQKKALLGNGLRGKKL